MNAAAPQALRKPQALELGLDQRPLFELGLRELRAYARELWTDHNIHDPGITALELLCYALTDLCYRACYPIEDLLAAREDNRAAMQSLFHSARPSLHNRPLTELDYRKLLIDVDGVRNAWIYRVERSYYADSIEGKLHYTNPGLPGIREVRLRGLYGALIEYADESASPAARRAVLDAARVALQDNRNLCEDFVEVEAVETQDFRLCAEIELEPNADPVQVRAAILVVVQLHLRPGVKRYTRGAMLERRNPDGSAYLADPDLFDGPWLTGGFIDQAELEQAGLREELRLSDIISLVMDVAGVRAVREIVVRPVADEDEDDAAPADAARWQVPVEPRKRARLDPERSRLVFYKGAMPVPSNGWQTPYARLLEEAEEGFRRRPTEDRPIPLGRFRDPAAYVSVQRHFPALYGIGDAGLPAGASAARRAEARQLQGYLLHYEQLMADYLAQLAHARELLSFDPEVERSYRCQAIESFRDFRELYPAAPDAAQRAAEDVESKTTPEAREAAREAWRRRIRDLLEGLAESAPAMLKRRNRFLDHLIARVAERLQDHLAISVSLFGLTPAATARAKCDFLRNYPTLGAERGRAFDKSLEAAGGTAVGNVSGLEKRLAHLLGIGAIAYEIYQEHDEDAEDEYRFRVLSRVSEGVLLSSDAPEGTQAQARTAMERALERAAAASGYQRAQTIDGRHYFNIVDAGGAVIARRIQYFASAASMEAAIAELTELAAHRGERACVIESILLRPEGGDDDDDTFLPICPEPDCGADCPGDDPYSYRLHIVLPAEAVRFREMAFRRYAEEVIRQETPAHLLAKICFVSDADLEAIEKAWGAWRALLARGEASGAVAELKALRDALRDAKNVYPPSTLAGCEAPEKFILGRTALGSAPPEA